MAPVLVQQMMRASQRAQFSPSVAYRSIPKAVRFVANAEDHDTSTQPVKEASEDFQKEIDAYNANEESAARLTPAEELRTLVASEKYGTVCTISSSGPTAGYAAGSVTPFAVDDQGRVMCCLSNLSSHKQCGAAAIC